MQPQTPRPVASKVTSKLQVTIPKALADRYGIRPGDEIVWEPAGGGLRIAVPGRRRRRLSAEERVNLLRESRTRQRAREAEGPAFAPIEGRGWTRDDLYEDRGGRSR